MFESDQHEFDDEYAEISHPPPPPPPQSPVATTPPAPPPTPRVACPEPIVEETEEEEEPEYEEEEPEEFVDPAEKAAVEEPPKKKKPINFVLIGGFAALVIFGIFIVMSGNKPKVDAPPPGDMGPGIVAAAGLRGHLNTKWDGDAKTGKLAYQLRIEPMEDRWGPGFSRATTHPPMPLSVNVRLLDASGFALCGKEIDFRFDPQNAGVPVAASVAESANGKKLSASARMAAMQAARQSEITQMQAAEVTRERGKDIFQNQPTNDGQVAAVNAQGTLPCSPDQYRHADYWDFNTNFPTLAEQAALVDPKSAMHAKEFDPPGHTEKRALTKWGDGFVIKGEDRVTGYDSVHGLLWAEEKTFAIDKRTGQTTASAWAAGYTLIHSKCDQHASCALTAAGQIAVLHARLSE